MPTNILMPALSPTMTEGTLARWLKKEGDTVKAGDVIAEIETDKATMEVEAVDEGVLGQILVPAGTAGVKVDAPIGVLRDEGEAADAAPAPEPAATETAPEPEAPAPEPPKAEAGETAAPAPEPPEAAPAPNGHDRAQGENRVFASPLARRMAQQAGIDLATIKGTGPNGRIVRADVEAAQGRSAPAPDAKPAPVPPVAKPPPAAPHTALPNSAMRRTIARRLTESHQSIPTFHVSLDIELDALLTLRAELNAKAAGDGPEAPKLSVNDLLIKSAAAALRRVPRLNASYTDEAILQFGDIDISVAVSVPDGLITPIIRRADQKGLGTISAEMQDLAARARAGKLKPEEFQGGTFSVSNLGMFGMRQFAAIINPPQAAILGVGAGEKRPVARGDALAVATVMTATLTVDHRVADGALAAEWMAAFKRLVEDPLRLLL